MKDSKKLDKEISKRIWVTRYLMVIGIIVLHMPPYQPLSELSGSLFEYVKAFFSHGVFRATVPVLTVISGYLVFQTGLHLNPKKLLLNKTKSILIPLILWNFPLVVTVFLIQKYEIFSHPFSASLYPFNTLSWLNASLGLTSTPINYPLNFLRDLFAVAMLSPIMWLFLKRTPYIGMAAILIVYYFNLDGQLILRNSMLVSFYLGALVACQNYDLKYLDKYAAIFSILFFLACALIVYFRVENRELFRLISPILIWPAMSMVVNTPLGNLLYNHSKNSFFTFLSHGPILLAIWLVYKKLPLEIPYLVFWIVAPFLTVLIAIFLNKLIKNKLPVISSIALGNR